MTVRLRSFVLERHPFALELVTEAFEAALQRIWFDAHVHDPRALRLLCEVAGEERLVMGTNFAGWDQGEPPAAGRLATKMNENARRLLRIAPRMGGRAG